MKVQRMRSRILFFFFLLCSVSVRAITFPEDAKLYNQLVDSVNRTVTLVFCIDRNHYAISPDSIQAVYAWGAMSDYKDAVATCRITDFSEDSCFYKTFSYDEIARPGDSGQPEFEFYTELLGDSVVYYTPDMMRRTDGEKLMFYNGITPVLIALPGGPEYMTTDWTELYARREEARIVKPLVDYDFSDTQEQHRISNFRLTVGTKNLYRSYHPYYPSMTRRDTEAKRLYWVSRLASEVGIRSAISLTGDLSYAEGEEYTCGSDSQTYVITIPDYYRALTDSGHLCYVSASATQCYYYTDGVSFANTMKQVVEFIADTTHPMPMQIHCAIGADRTGVVCAVISALCGASWADIMSDYHATSDMLVQTYRHPNRLIYALERMTGLRADKCTAAQLSTAIRYHLVDRMDVLTDAEIDAMVARLMQTTPTEITSINVGVDTNKMACYDILGRQVSVTTPGVQIRIDAQGRCTKQVVRP